MMTVKEARRLTDEAIEKEIKMIRRRAEEFCESLNGKIKQACEMKKNSLIITDVPADLSDCVFVICESNGFNVLREEDGKQITLKW